MYLIYTWRLSKNLYTNIHGCQFLRSHIVKNISDIQFFESSFIPKTTIFHQNDIIIVDTETTSEVVSFATWVKKRHQKYSVLSYFYKFKSKVDDFPMILWWSIIFSSEVLHNSLSFCNDCMETIIEVTLDFWRFQRRDFQSNGTWTRFRWGRRQK